MLKVIPIARLAIEHLRVLFGGSDEGQDVFEYLLIVAGISVVIIAAGAIAVPGLFQDIVDALCGAVEGIGDDADADAIGILGDLPCNN